MLGRMKHLDDKYPFALRALTTLSPRFHTLHAPARMDDAAISGLASSQSSSKTLSNNGRITSPLVAGDILPSLALPKTSPAFSLFWGCATFATGRSHVVVWGVGRAASLTGAMGALPVLLLLTVVPCFFLRDIGSSHASGLMMPCSSAAFIASS